MAFQLDDDLVLEPGHGAGRRAGLTPFLGAGVNLVGVDPSMDFVPGPPAARAARSWPSTCAKRSTAIETTSRRS